MSKLLTVFGATGNQGGSVIKHILSDPELSKVYKIRAVTRDQSSVKARDLASSDVEVVTGDPDDRDSLRKILSGTHTVFAMTTSNYAGEEGHSEINQGKNIVDAAIAEGVQFLIWSSLPSPTKISEGKYTHVTSFDHKASIEDYIRSKPIKSAFYAPGSFMQNFATIMKPHPSWKNDGTYVIARPVAASTKLPLVDIAGDTGKFVTAILANPDGFEGKTICGASKLYSMEEQAQIMAQQTGKTIAYQQIPSEQYKSYLPPNNVDELMDMLLYQEEFGYYGSETESLVKWSVESARGTPISFEDFLKQNPLVLE